MPPFNPLITFVTIAVVVGTILGLVSYLILLERKLSAYMQDRIGPNRVGPFGLVQPIVDGLKMLLKEDIVPSHVDKLFYWLAPAIAGGTALLAFAVIPFGPTTAPPGPIPLTSSTDARLGAEDPLGILDDDEIPERPVNRFAQERQARANYAEQEQAYRAVPYQAVIAPGIDIGILFTFAVSSLAVYGIVLGGWSANNKYSLLGALRSSAQIISYEIPLGMSILGIVLFAGSLNLERIIEQQTIIGWNVLFQPLAFLLFLIAVFAECNRLPFDLPEAEQELVGGYHTEYSSLKFGLFFLGEYTHMITTSFLLAVLFFGGWHLPIPFLTWDLGGWVDGYAGMLIHLAVMLAKMSGFIVFYMLIRWTIPRFRFDQLMGLAWKVLIPLSLANLVAVLIVRELGAEPWMMTIQSIILLIGATYLSVGEEAEPPGPATDLQETEPQPISG